MKSFKRNFGGILLSVVCAFMTAPGVCATAENPRGGSAGVSDVAPAKRAAVNSAGNGRAATNVRQTSSRGIANPATSTDTTASGVAMRTSAPARATSNARVSRATNAGVARSAINSNLVRSSAARAATTNVSRAGVARATAVFSDLSKIGSGYSACREAYATCMDQFCANANDTYRRCFCSDRFIEFRNTEDAIDQAKVLLMRFQDVNLDAVDKTAAEVNAMYTATAGEMAVKKDTSAAAKMLDEITDLLSGKKSAGSYTNTSTSLGILSFDFSADLDDIWSGGGFFGDSVTNLVDLEGKELYDAANKQCLKVIADSCESTTVLNMATSSYGILITQDCNAYQKNVDSKKEAVEQTVRTAEKYLREARLEEYRSHNSADVNECITKVRNAMTSDVACGANYKRCLDYTGVYINQTTGEPIYSTRLFQMKDLIKLSGMNEGSANMDILSQNPQFNQFLESRKMYATTALDSCRDLSTTVWNEFKRTALIEIAQAQDEKIEEVKMSCVSTMSECYDTQRNALKSFDNTTVKVTGALTARAARTMCEEKVVACAALYGDTDGCAFDGNGKLTSGQGTCGLSMLLKFVDTVDTVRIAEGCATAIDNYVKDLCTPTTGTRGYPWNCRTLSSTDIKNNITKFANNYCANPTSNSDTVDAAAAAEITTQVDRAYNDLLNEMDAQLAGACLDLGGFWVVDNNINGKLLTAFYSNVTGGNQDAISIGRCLQNDTKVSCLAYNSDEDTEDMASYNSATDECTFTEEWYKIRCTWLGTGYYENGICYTTE